MVVLLMMIIAAAFIPIQLFALTCHRRYSGRAVKAAVPSTFVRLMQVPLGSSRHVSLHALVLKCLRFNILTAFPDLSTFCRAQKRRKKKLRRIPPPATKFSALYFSTLPFLLVLVTSCISCAVAASCDVLLILSCPSATGASATSRVASLQLRAFHCHLALPPSPSARCSVRTPLPPRVGKLHCSQVRHRAPVHSAQSMMRLPLRQLRPRMLVVLRFNAAPSVSALVLTLSVLNLLHRWVASWYCNCSRQGAGYDWWGLQRR